MPNNRLALWVGLFLIVFGAIFVSITFNEISQYLDSDNWQSVQGQITELGIESYIDDGSYMYEAQVVYKYTVGGANYTGDRVRFGGGISSSDEGRAERMIAPYERGAFVTVYYDPFEPSRVVLERNLDWLIWLFVGIGGTFALIGVFVLLSLLFPQRQT
ncbi:MAG: DUF3592 domain-containing protein [Phototrophicaceae bacterium]